MFFPEVPTPQVQVGLVEGDFMDMGTTADGALEVQAGAQQGASCKQENRWQGQSGLLRGMGTRARPRRLKRLAGGWLGRLTVGWFRLVVSWAPTHPNRPQLTLNRHVTWGFSTVHPYFEGAESISGLGLAQTQ